MYRAFYQEYSSRIPVLLSEVEVCSENALIDDASTKTLAVWDTGATVSFISRQIATQLSLAPSDFEPVIGMNGEQMGGLVYLSMKLPNGLIIPDKRVLVCDLPSSVNVLIGMDIIQIGDFHISNGEGKTVFSFVIPSFPTSFNLAKEADRLNQRR
jgi:predicted aspartyl protease